MGRNVDGTRNGLGCVPDRIYRGVGDWEDGVINWQKVGTFVFLAAAVPLVLFCLGAFIWSYVQAGPAGWLLLAVIVMCLFGGVLMVFGDQK